MRSTSLAAAAENIRPAAQVDGRRWFEMTNLTEGAASIYIYDEVGAFGITAADFVAELNGVQAQNIDLHINSPGGDIFDGVTIFNALVQHRAQVTTYVDGLAASAASFITQAGDRRVMAQTATMMIHDGQGVVVGDAADMRDMADLLDKESNIIAGIYARRAGGDVADWRARMQDTAWFNADEAVTAGLADEIQGKAPADDPPADEPQNQAPSFDAAALHRALKEAMA